MAAWQAALRAYPLDWLLAEDNPAVRYLALTRLLNVPETAPEAQTAREAIMETGYVPALLALQDTPAYRAAYPRFYTAKYKGLVWSLIVLAEHRAMLTPRIAAQCEYLLQNAQELTDGGFAQAAAQRTGGGRLSEVIPCLTGNLVWCFYTLGLGSDPRVQKGLDWLTRNTRLNDGQLIDPPAAPYARLEMCWGAHTCHMGVVKALKAYGAVPPEQRTPALEAAVARAAEFMLIHRVDRRSHAPTRLSKPGWRKFGFPLMYQTDTLEVLDVLTALGIRDPRMAEAVQAVVDKQGADGCWRMENAYAGERILLPGEPLGAPSKWLTLRALCVLRRYLGD
jgi:hypothetical protein